MPDGDVVVALRQALRRDSNWSVVMEPSIELCLVSFLQCWIISCWILSRDASSYLPSSNRLEYFMEACQSMCLERGGLVNVESWAWPKCKRLHRQR